MVMPRRRARCALIEDRPAGRGQLQSLPLETADNPSDVWYFARTQAENIAHAGHLLILRAPVFRTLLGADARRPHHQQSQHRSTSNAQQAQSCRLQLSPVPHNGSLLVAQAVKAASGFIALLM
jgi:hypothetical protein